MVQLSLATFFALVACAACVPASYEYRNVEVDEIIPSTPDINILPIPVPEPEPLPVPAAPLLGGLIYLGGYGTWGYGPGVVLSAGGDVNLGLEDISRLSLLNPWGLSGAPLGLPVVGGGIPILGGLGLGGGLIGINLNLLNVGIGPYLVPVQSLPQPQPEPEVLIPIPEVPSTPEVGLPSY